MRSNRRGFTIIELTIAMAFLSILLIAILVLTLNAGKLYIKGNTTKNANQSGRDLADMVRRDFLASNASNIAVATDAMSGRADESRLSGRVCLGQVSYVWNTADLLNDETSGAHEKRITFARNGVKDDSRPARLVRVVDPNLSFCAPQADGKYRTLLPDTATEMLGDGREFAVYKAKVSPIAVKGSIGLYRFAYTVGTNEKGTTETGAAGFVECKPNDSVTANFNYCSVNDFSMIVRVGGAQ